MKICKPCFELLDWPNSPLYSNPEYYFPSDLVGISQYYCINNFLDHDDIVKSCLMYLSGKFKRVFNHQNQPERSKREDLDCCKVRENASKLYKIVSNRYLHDFDADILNFSRKLLQESKMRCSEHCGNTVREVQKASSPK